ncbi:MAG TPA: hypothetical protein VM802_31595 [Chitinophaga sp.]|uniref:hypothetical protein n=1 Tax=Chitinophaga sp. TaxID=1869181 RepID=UPI002B7B2695|nr:hypothetical protein [Chitinophaga sp.]HVI49453.1 hypothetical protein [Chitinophaga sp.]
MLRPLFLLAVTAAVVSACNQSQPDTNTTANDSITAVPAPKAAPAATPMDTVQIGNVTFFAYYIDKAEFDKYAKPDPDTSESNLLAHDKDIIREGNSLHIKLANGLQLTRTNVDSDGDDYVRYSYDRNYADIHRKGLFLSLYEAQGYELINQQNGDTLITWSAPVVSPDRKYLLCANLDMVAGFDPNGFQLFKLENDVIKPVGEALIEDWGPGKTFWIDNNTILAEYRSYDKTDHEINRHVKLVMQ